MKRILIKDPIYHATFLVQRGGDAQSLIDSLAKRLKVETWQLSKANRYGHFAAYRPHKDCAIWLHSRAGVGVLSHECLHAVNYLFSECLDCSLCEKTEEVFAYYIEFLTREITRQLY